MAATIAETITTNVCSNIEIANAVSLGTLYIANAASIANWYGPINIDVDGIIQANEINGIMNNTTDQSTLQLKPAMTK